MRARRCRIPGPTPFPRTLLRFREGRPSHTTHRWAVLLQARTGNVSVCCVFFGVYEGGAHKKKRPCGIEKDRRALERKLGRRAKGHQNQDKTRHSGLFANCHFCRSRTTTAEGFRPEFGTMVTSAPAGELNLFNQRKRGRTCLQIAVVCHTKKLADIPVDSFFRTNAQSFFLLLLPARGACPVAVTCRYTHV